jgi:hypothetical protein
MTKFKSALADFLLLAGLALACWGVFKFSPAAGYIACGTVLFFLARSITPEKKKN